MINRCRLRVGRVNGGVDRFDNGDDAGEGGSWTQLMTFICFLFFWEIFEPNRLGRLFP